MLFEIDLQVINLVEQFVNHLYFRHRWEFYQFFLSEVILSEPKVFSSFTSEISLVSCLISCFSIFILSLNLSSKETKLFSMSFSFYKNIFYLEKKLFKASI